ncbi:MAG: biotin--[acetyl-CoA-carboxylase] ligase [Deltaproteobacteria bacterium]|nr:MAG: biotin--[acetyl-CoA-carboxylase] ligase [Deltaproteobacteria bacterium]
MHEQPRKNPPQSEEVYSYTSIDSTNNTAKELAEKGSAQGCMVVALQQTAGRGRLGKKWHSPAGKGLYCSLIVRPEISADDLPMITLAAGAGLALLFEDLTCQPVGLKWPNDIFIFGKKCAGILTESVGSAAGDRSAIVGIGVNVTHRTEDFPEELRKTSTSLFMVSGKVFDLDLLAQKIRTCVLEKVADLERGMKADIIDCLNERDVMRGRSAQWVTAERKLVKGIAEGVDACGLLRIRDGEGKLHKVLSGDIRLAETDSSFDPV